MEDKTEFQDSGLHVTEKTISYRNIEIFLKERTGILSHHPKIFAFIKRLFRKTFLDPEDTPPANLKFALIDFHPALERGELAIDYLIKSTGKDYALCYYIAYSFHLPFDKLQNPISDLAYSERIVLELVRTFCFKPRYLIMEDPAKLLDWETQILLENFLQKYYKENNAGFLVCSRDRDFLLRNCDTVIESKENRLLQHKVRDYFFSSGHSRLFPRQHLDKLRVVFFTLRNIIPYGTYNFFSPLPEFLHFTKQLLPKKKILELIQPLELKIENKIRTVSAFLELYKNEKYLVTGARQSGKSQLLRIITKEIIADSSIPENKIVFFPDPELSGFRKELTIEENLKNLFFSDSGDAANLFTANSLFSRFGIPEDIWKKYPHEVDKNKRNILTLLSQLIKKPEILILEEPEKYFDPDSLAKLAIYLRKSQMTVIFTSYYRTFAESLAEKLIIIKDGAVKIYRVSVSRYMKKLRIQFAHRNRELQREGITVTFQKKKYQRYHKNGTSPLAVKNKKDPASYKKALLLFFDKNYQARRKEIKKLRQELMEMEMNLRELEQKRNELWDYINRNNLHTPENYEKMHKIDRKLEELIEKWKLLQSKLEELDSL